MLILNECLWQMLMFDVIHIHGYIKAIPHNDIRGHHRQSNPSALFSLSSPSPLFSHLCGLAQEHRVKEVCACVCVCVCVCVFVCVCVCENPLHVSMVECVHVCPWRQFVRPICCISACHLVQAGTLCPLQRSITLCLVNPGDITLLRTIRTHRPIDVLPIEGRGLVAIVISVSWVSGKHVIG